MAFSTQQRTTTTPTTTTTSNDQSYNREEEYRSAQRAAVESVMIGRETLEATTRQGEQLRNAEYMADDTEFKLDRASRLLRGMTWSGWLANKFSRDTLPPEYKTDNVAEYVPPKVYDNVPVGCEKATQAVQNYHCNLQVLEACEEEEQKATCVLICDQMYNQAKKEIEALHLKGNTTSATERERDREFPSRLSNDISLLRNRQRQSQNQLRRSTPTNNNNNNNNNNNDTPTNRNRASLFADARKSTPVATKTTTAAANTASPIDAVTAQQDEHLGIMSQHLDELASLAVNLNQSLGSHTVTIDSLEEKSDSMIFKSKMVTRRADRLIQKKSWSKTKAEFEYDASIRHISTGKYLAVSSDNNKSLMLSEKFNETCIFGIWKRQGKIFGLKNKYSRKWVGQNLLGNLVCSANNFDRREEWDADDDDWTSTHLICASAGWGNGGYLIVNPEDEVISIGGGGFQDKKNADLWCIKMHEQ